MKFDFRRTGWILDVEKNQSDHCWLFHMDGLIGWSSQDLVHVCYSFVIFFLLLCFFVSWLMISFFTHPNISELAWCCIVVEIKPVFDTLKKWKEMVPPRTADEQVPACFFLSSSCRLNLLVNTNLFRPAYCILRGTRTGVIATLEKIRFHLADFFSSEEVDILWLKFSLKINHHLGT